MSELASRIHEILNTSPRVGPPINVPLRPDELIQISAAMFVSEASGGAGRIVAERFRQINVLARTAEIDDQYTGGELAWAATCYAAPWPVFRVEPRQDAFHVHDPWPWHDAADMRPRDQAHQIIPFQELPPLMRVRVLEKAGALIAAEIDRLLRAQAQAEGRQP